MKRIEALDYLRGLMAASVMVYHYVSWATPSHSSNSESLLGKLGIYAVSIFYILSGLSLSLVYKNKLSSGTEIRSYFIKRIFRIFPLFWFCTTIALLYKYAFSIISGEPFVFPLYKAILNYSLTFGFIDNSAYLTTGAWSIGNEMVFYLTLPFILFLNRGNGVAICCGTMNNNVIFFPLI